MPPSRPCERPQPAIPSRPKLHARERRRRWPRAQNIPVAEARTQVQQYEAQFREGIAATQREATEAAAAATTAVSRAALIGALALLLGAVAAWFGGRMGAVDPTVTTYTTVQAYPAE